MKTSTSNFRCDRVRLYFFYPVVTSSWASKLQEKSEIEFETIKIKVDLSKSSKDVLISSANSFDVKIGPSYAIEEDLLQEGLPLEPASYVPIVHAWCGEDSLKDQIKIPATVTLSARAPMKQERTEEVNLFFSCDVLQSGAGCAVIRLEFKNEPVELEGDEIIALTTLGQKISEKAKLEVGGKQRNLYKNLYSVFLTFTHVFLSELGSKIASGEAYEPSGSEGFKWLDLEMFNRDPKREHDQPHLTPSILTVLYGEQKFESWRRFRLEATRADPPKSVATIEEALIPLLLRSHRPSDVDPSFLKASILHSGEILPNMSPTVDFFMHFHLRSCLAIAKDKSDEMVKASEPLLKETLKLVRMRWYHLIISDMKLDDALAYVTASLARPALGYSKNDKKTESSNVKDEHLFRKKFRSYILEVRASILRAFHDPATYRIGSGSLIELYQEASRQLDLAELEKNVAQKLDSLGLLYRDVIDHWRLGETDLLKEEWEQLWSEKQRYET